MAITKQPKASRSEAFTAEAPDAKPMPKLRGRRQPIALALPPGLLRTIDEFAAQERREPGEPDRDHPGRLGPSPAGEGGRLMARRESQRVTELQKLRAELVKQLDRLDFRSEIIGPALAKMAQHAERTIRRR